MIPILNKIVSPLQGAFIPGGWIPENVLLAKEIVDSMKTKQGDSGIIGVKVDMMKAYDRLEWDFLFRILKRLGFSERSVNLIVGTKKNKYVPSHKNNLI